MRFLLDQNVSPVLVGLLAEAGHSAEHLRDLGLSRAPDHEVLATATTTGAVLVSSDTDFGELLARSNAAGPSVILLRRQEDRVLEKPKPKNTNSLHIPPQITLKSKKNTQKTKKK